MAQPTRHSFLPRPLWGKVASGLRHTRAPVGGALRSPGTTFPCSKALNHALCVHAQSLGPFACLDLRREPPRGTDDSCTGSIGSCTGSIGSCTGSIGSGNETCGYPEAC